MVVSSGRPLGVIESRGWGSLAVVPISWRNRARSGSQSASSSQTGIGTTIFGSSWATSSAAFVGDSCPPIGTQTTSTEPISPIFSSVRVWAMSPEVDDVDAVDLDHEGHVAPALGAPLVVAEGADAVDEDVLHLVLARAVEDERLRPGSSGGGSPRRGVARPFALGSGVSSGWL